MYRMGLFWGKGKQNKCIKACPEPFHAAPQLALPFCSLCHQQQGGCDNANCPCRQGNAPGTGAELDRAQLSWLRSSLASPGERTSDFKQLESPRQRGRAALALVEFKSGLLRRPRPSAPGLLIICRLESPRKEQNSSRQHYLRKR